jgi:hypothetical protein
VGFAQGDMAVAATSAAAGAQVADGLV